MTCGFLIQLVFCQKKEKLVVYWFWSKTRDEVGEFTLNTVLKNGSLALNSAVSFDMYSQQFTLCYCLVKSLQKPSSWYSLLKCIYVTSQLCHSLAVHPLLRKLLDPPLHLLPAYSSMTLNTSLNNLVPRNVLWSRKIKAMFTLVQIAFAPTRKLYRTGLLFTHKSGDSGAISVTARSCSAPHWSVEGHISDRCSH